MLDDELIAASARQAADLTSPEPPSDAALARRAGLGDEEAFTDLFHRHFHTSFRYALTMLNGDDDQASEASQDAWVKAWRNLPEFRGESKFLTWLLTIVSREVLDHRRRRRPVPVDDAAFETHGNTNPDGDPAGDLLDRELWETLSVALSELPWRQRASWLLRELDGQSYEEIAQILDTTPTVVRGQLHRARRGLALRMEQWR